MTLSPRTRRWIRIAEYLLMVAVLATILYFFAPFLLTGGR